MDDSVELANKAKNDGVTPLHAAAYAQWPRAVEIWLGLCPVMANRRTFATGKPKG